MAYGKVPGAGHQFDRFECRLPPNPRSLARLRAAFSAWLGDAGIGAAGRQDAVLVMSELAGSTLDGPPATRPPLRACAWMDAAGMSIEVRDDHDGTWNARVRSLDHDSARGLAVVATLADVFARRAVEGGGKALTAHMNWKSLGAEPVSR